jgi:hypothetical protein
MKLRSFGNKQSTSSVDLLKVESGKDVRGVFAGDPVEWFVHWPDGADHSTICVGRKSCELCREGDKAKFRFRVNFIINENGAFTAKIFEGGAGVYKQLKELQDAGWDLEKNLMIIKKTGEKLTTRWTISPVPNGALSESQLKVIKQMPLHLMKVEQDDDEPTDTQESTSEIPF